MRILAIEVENPGISSHEFTRLQKAEAKIVWRLYQEDFIREMYFRGDQTSAVLLLECSDIAEAQRKLAELPMVSEGLINFDLIPLVPYPGLSRLFSD